MTENECLVIQPFDNGGTYDNLYDLVIETAIVKAGGCAVRIDKILGTKPPLEKLRDKIESASICIAEATENNPNVYYEIGWAFAIKKPIFILWDKCKREYLPFDIHGKAGIPYNSSKPGWQKQLMDSLQNNIIEELSILEHNIRENISIGDKQLNLTDIDCFILIALLKSEANNQSIGVIGMRHLLRDNNLSVEEGVLSLNKLEEEELIDRNYNTYGDEVCQYYLIPKGKKFITSRKDILEKFRSRVPEELNKYKPTPISSIGF